MTRYDLYHSGNPIAIEVEQTEEGFDVVIDGDRRHISLGKGKSPGSLVALFSDKPASVTVVRADSQQVELIVDGERLIYARPLVTTKSPTTSAVPHAREKGEVMSPMPGKVIGALVKAGDKVKNGDPLIILESMKMEIAVRADRDGKVLEILVGEGTAVKRGQSLVRLG